MVLLLYYGLFSSYYYDRKTLSFIVGVGMVEPVGLRHLIYYWMIYLNMVNRLGIDILYDKKDTQLTHL